MKGSGSSSASTLTEHEQLNKNNKRLFVGSLPKDKEQRDVLLAMKDLVSGLKNVIMYPSQQDKTKSRGYAFVEFDSHQSALDAREKLQAKPPKLWGVEIKVDWAEPENEVDEETMKTVKVLFVRNLHNLTSEETLRQQFGQFGLLERVRKQNDYAFIHFAERKDAEKALREKNNTAIDGCNIEVMWSKPVKDPAKYKQRRADRFQSNTTNAFTPGSLTPFQFLAMQSPLLQNPLLRPTAAPFVGPGVESLLPDGSINMPYIPGFNGQPAAHFQMGYPAATTTATLLAHHPQSESYASSEDMSVGRQLGAALGNVAVKGNAPGPLRTTVSPQVQQRPYSVPSTMQHLQQHQQQQQQQQQQQHQVTMQSLALQQSLPQPIPVLQHAQQIQMFQAGAGSDFSALGYPAAFTMYPGPMMPLLSPPQGHEFLRPTAQYPEN